MSIIKNTVVQIMDSNSVGELVMVCSKVHELSAKSSSVKRKDNAVRLQSLSTPSQQSGAHFRASKRSFDVGCLAGTYGICMVMPVCTPASREFDRVGRVCCGEEGGGLYCKNTQSLPCHCSCSVFLIPSLVGVFFKTL